MFLADFGAYDVQFEGFGGDYVFWAGSAQSEGRRHMHPRIKSPPERRERALTVIDSNRVFNYLYSAARVRTSSYIVPHHAYNISRHRSYNMHLTSITSLHACIFMLHTYSSREALHNCGTQGKRH